MQPCNHATCSEFLVMQSCSEGSLELPQEPQIPLEEEADVRDLVADHEHALHAETESEALPLVRIDPDVPEHLRMHHAAAHHLQPPTLAALFFVSTPS